VLDCVFAAAFLRGRRRFRALAIAVSATGILRPIAVLATSRLIDRPAFLIEIIALDAVRAGLFAAAVVVLLTGRATGGRFALGMTLVGLFLAALGASYLLPLARAARLSSAL
jgi:hypothetical protein